MLNSTQEKRIEAGKNGEKNGKVLCKLMNNAVYGKKIGKLKKYNRGKVCKQQKRLFKMDIHINLYVA